MFTVRPADVESLRSPGGERFAGFVNDLIRAHARTCGVPANEVHLNLQTNLADGGVDAEVTVAAPRDADGLLAHPTVWQFKASEAHAVRPANLRGEIQKPHARRRIKEGFLYYACICDQLSQDMRSGREGALIAEVQKINSTSPTPHVLDAEDLAALASRYPAVALRHFRPQMGGWCLSLDAWQPNAVGLTAQYVETPALAEARACIDKHLSLAADQLRDVVLVVRGQAGVGKTRLVFEAVRKAPDSEVLSVFAIDEAAALRLATHIANTSLSAILIADEITARGVAQLRRILEGHRDRVRVVAVESTVEDYRPEDDEAVWVGNAPSTTLDEILKLNFPEVTPERRRAYSYLADGSIRFAVELCRRDTELALVRSVPRPSFVRDYLRDCLESDEQEAVWAIALVYGVGWRDEVAQEIEHLCDCLRLPADRVRRSVARIRDAPGFVAAAGQYWYVKPPIVAQMAFEEGWRHWAAHDESGFLRQIAGSGLLKPFLRQVGRAAPAAVRERVARFFRDWAEGLGASSLAQREDTDRLLNLVEVDPAGYLPTLRRLIDQAADDELVTAVEYDPSRRQARHEFVRTARRVAILPECFHDAEAILLRLAIGETDSRLADNATRTHRQLFKIFLSGTVLAFSDRLAVLSQRVHSEDDRVAALAIEALFGVFDRHHSRGLDEPVVAGQIAAEDWVPQTWADRDACLAEAMVLLQATMAEGRARVRERIWEHVITGLSTLVDFGFASAIKQLFPVEIVPSATRERLVIAIEEHLCSLDDTDDEAERRRLISAEDEAVLRQLVTSFRPVGLHGRLVVAVGAVPWRVGAYDPTSSWRAELRTIVGDFLQSPKELDHALAWLFSPAARAAHEFGLELGGQDHGGVFFATVMSAALQESLHPFPLGYVKGLMDHTSDQDDRINHYLDDAEVRAPLMSFYIAASAGDRTHSLKRMLRLVDAGRVPAAHLRTGLRGRHLIDSEFEQVLKRMVSAAEQGDVEAAACGIELVHLRAKQAATGKSIDQVPLRGLLLAFTWRLVEILASNPREVSSAWGELLTALAPSDSARAAQVAATGLASGGRAHMVAASSILADLAATVPELVMDKVGQVMIDPELAFPFLWHSHSDVIGALSWEVVAEWLDSSGAEGAMALAWHLPRPYVSQNGSAEVPPLTTSFLGRFGQDEVVFERFCRSTVSDARIGVEDLYTGLARRKEYAAATRAFEAHSLPILRKWARWVQEDARVHERWIGKLGDDDAVLRFR